MARKKLSAIEKEYNKQIRNLNRRIKRAEEKGYIYLIDPSPAKPKKITPASVEKIKNIRGEKLTRKASGYVSPLTGELISPKSKKAKVEEKEFERQKREALRKARQGKDITEYQEAVKEYVIRKTVQKTQEPPEELPANITPVNFDGVWDETPGVDTGIISAIKDMIDMIPDVKYYGYKNEVWYDSVKEYLKGMLDEYSTAYEETPVFTSYIDYLYSKEEDIFEYCLDTIFASKQANVETHINRLTEIIKGGALSKQELKALEKVNEYYENYEV